MNNQAPQVPFNDAVNRVGEALDMDAEMAANSGGRRQPEAGLSAEAFERPELEPGPDHLRAFVRDEEGSGAAYPVIEASAPEVIVEAIAEPKKGNKALAAVGAAAALALVAVVGPAVVKSGPAKSKSATEQIESGVSPSAIRDGKQFSSVVLGKPTYASKANVSP